MTYKLYIDDERTPKRAGWTIVRSFDQAVSTIKENGVPDEISFDHDLGWDMVTNKEAKSGYDLAKWLVENNIVLKKFNVHSANPVGKENIERLLTNYQHFVSKNNVTL